MPAFIHWNIDPVIFEFGFLSLRWYSLSFALGFILSYKILSFYFRSENTPLQLLDSLTIYMVVSTVVGARLGHCLFYDFDYYSKHIPEIFLPVKFDPRFEFTGFQGLASHGGAIGILIAIIIFSRRYKVEVFWVLDKLSLVIPLAGFLIRMGNLMNSEMIGKPSFLRWAFVFDRVDKIPRHPGQLYEAIFYFGIFMFLNLFYRHAKKQSGFVFGLFLILLFSARFIVEYTKEVQSDFEAGMVLNMGQLLSLPFILFGLLLMFFKRQNLLVPRSH